VVEYQDLLKAELGKSEEDYKNRLAEIRNEIMATGTYQQTYEEISYGAKVRRPLSLWLSSSPTLT
jgi:nitric oxide synthase oxygenase domain/subunit